MVLAHEFVKEIKKTHTHINNVLFESLLNILPLLIT